MTDSIFVLDTNILVSIITKPNFEDYFYKNYLQKDSRFIVSVVTEGELRAIASKRKWGDKKRSEVNQILANYLIYPIKMNRLIDAYAEIDTYSQGLLANRPLSKNMSSRNMGKNDLWIAATTHILNATLVTTDKDFDHLDSIYFKRDLIDIGKFR